MCVRALYAICMHECVSQNASTNPIPSGGRISHTQETPRKAQNKRVQAHDERAHTVTEETLVKILTGRRHAYYIHAWLGRMWGAHVA